jgi:hypothetical protein
MVLSSFRSSSRLSSWLDVDDEGTSEDVLNTRMKEESFSHALPTDRDANNPDIFWSTSALLWRADGATNFGTRGGIGGAQAHEKLEDTTIGYDVLGWWHAVK